MCEGLSEVCVRSENFAIRDIPLREAVLGRWFRRGSLGFIFGKRGTGKTWFAWDMAISVSKGMGYGPWKCEKSHKVLYVDGEMPQKSMQDRLKLLNPNHSGDLYILSREEIVNKLEMHLNLCEKCQQEALLEYCVRESFKVIFLDNLSSLCWGMKENEADSWEQVLSWLLMFRGAGIAIVIVHHANRDGNDMRGTSKREDPADWIIRLAQNNVSMEAGEGTSFYNEFTKNRDDGGIREKPLNWTFTTQNGQTVVEWKAKDTKELVYELVKQGVESNSDIAQELDISTAFVSKCANLLIAENFIKKQGSRYVPSFDR
jgi:putative DNA primase/helicase